MKIVVILIAVMVLAPILIAEDTGTLTLSDCLRIALSGHPSIHAATADVRAARARIVTAGSLSQPELSFDSDLQPRLFSFRRSGESYLGLSQTIDWPGKLVTRSGIARQEARESGFEADQVKCELILQVKLAFFSLLAAEEQAALGAENLELARDFLTKAKLKFEAGDAPQIEMMKAEVETARAETELMFARSRVKTATVTLNTLLGRPVGAPLPIRGEMKPLSLEMDPVRLQEYAQQHRPEILRGRTALKRSSLVQKQAGLGYLPDLTLGVARHRIVGETSTWDVTVALQFPLFFWQGWRGEIREAAALKEKAAAELALLEKTVLQEVEIAWQNLTAMNQQIRFFEDQVLRQAEEVYRKTMFSYQEGEVGYVELIESRRTLIETKKTYTDVLFQYQAALGELEKAVGRTLTEDHHG